MNTLEQRLRRELPELADALTGTTERDVLVDRPAAASAPPSERSGRQRSTRALVTGIAAASVLVLIGGLVAVRQYRASDDSSSTTTETEAPTGFGSWDPIPDAPIAPRPQAMVAWTGIEAVFWAGSSLSHGFAYTDGAAYDPATDSWRLLNVPGWGHPGLTSVYFDGELYALAKGGGTRYDPVEGTWVDLPEVESVFLAAAVATDDAVWGLGPTATGPNDRPDIMIVRYEPETDAWNDASVFTATGDTGDIDDIDEIISGLGMLETQVVWTGEEVLAWNGTHGGIAFEPDSGRWRTVAAPTVPSGAAADGVLVVTNSGPALVAEVDRSDDRSFWDVAVRAGDEWIWRGDRIPIDAPETVSAVAAGDWIVVFSALQSPVTVHEPSGAWKEHGDGPLQGVTAPNAAWTGDRLIVWGGVTTAPDDGSPPVTGAIWSPPSG